MRPAAPSGRDDRRAVRACAPWRLAAVACLALAASACGRDDQAASGPATDPPPADTAVMRPAPASPATEAALPASSPPLLPPGGPATAAQTQWKCADQRIAVRLDAASQSLSLVHERGQLALPRREAASGARYADANGNEFWEKGDTATLTLSGTPPRACTRVENGVAD